MSVLKKISLLLMFNIIIQIIQTSSRTSYLWKLNTEKKVIEAGNIEDSDNAEEVSDDPIFNIIISTEDHGDFWTKASPDDYSNSFCLDCYKLNSSTQIAPKPLFYTMPQIEQKFVNQIKLTSSDEQNEIERSAYERLQRQNETQRRKVENETESEMKKPEDSEVLDCGKPAQYTQYDHLLGVANRCTHPNATEQHLTLIFKKKGHININALERKLKVAKRDQPKSVQLYNRIGNFWRIKGDTNRSIECFRRALAVSPHNAEVLLNLARVLYAVKYHDDAIYLTRKSLEVQPPDKSAWQQYFTLGEIFKASGQFQEAMLNLRHCLQLNPHYEPAVELLKMLELYPYTSVHICTFLIIIFLGAGVLLAIISFADPSLYKTPTPILYNESIPQCPGQHCDRALQMRPCRFAIATRTVRNRRYN